MWNAEHETMECLVYPDSVRTTILSAANEELQIHNTLTLTILLKERVLRDFIVTFPWGDRSEHMTTLAMAQGITCSPLTGNWMVSRESAPDIGDYWRISGGSEQDGMIQIRWENLAAIREGITCILVKAVQVDAVTQDSGFYQLPLFKYRPDLRINTFSADRGTVKKGRAVTLYWQVEGAQSCVLDPGNIPVRAEGSRSFFLQNEEIFTLRAFCGRKAVSETRRIYLTE